jgi:aminopeptidase N
MRNIHLFLTALLLFQISALVAQTDIHSGLMKNYDVKHYNLDLEVSNISPAISGNVTILSEVVTSRLDTFVVELINTTSAINFTYMIVDSVKINQTIHSFTHKNDLVIVPLINPVNHGALFTAQVFYHGLATAFDYQRMYDGVIVSNNGIRVVENQKQSFSMSESRGAKVWWPCKQDLYDKADSVTIYITTDSINKSGSNGVLTSIQYLPGKRVRYKWETKYPIDYYLISFAVGPYEEHTAYAHLTSSTDSVKIQSLLNKNSINYRRNLKGIEVTSQLIKVYSDLLGDYPYKNEKYGYCVVDTTVDGMENQTMTTINSNVFDSIPGVFSYYAPSWITAHELAHSWFGDNVTCKTWNDIWINEGFASYMEYVALQKLHLDDLAKEWMYASHGHAQLYGGSVYVKDITDDQRIFSFGLTYKKGAIILHTLRYEINDDSVFFKGIKDYLAKYSHSVASGADFQKVMETTTGMNLSDFFNQWYYGEAYPVFNVSWNQSNDTLSIISDQTTDSPETPLFKTHFDVMLKFPASDSIIRLYQNINNQIFKIPVKEKVTSIEIDPYNWILKRVRSITTRINDINESSDSIRVYPNPFSDKANLEFYLTKAQTVRIEIYSINGSLIETKTINGTEGSNLSIIGNSLNNGIYFCRIITNETIRTLKLIKL